MINWSCVYSCMTVSPWFVTCRCLSKKPSKMWRYDTFHLKLCFNFKKVINADLTASQTAENLVKDLFVEHKKTRMSGDPRDFVDCYFDELDKVCTCVCVFPNKHCQYILCRCALNVVIFIERQGSVFILRKHADHVCP